ncbi:30S ribosomal protein S12 methylthiotransferase RimO [Hydrogenibacillus schlegelii]|uniref:Ribosomal protein uS12 methylthiotransferase RimO n=1 Tax=Hydrogenibacillus schlegelii TaxID=1484 RepID=A0A132N7V4_HYDSH|nr:30S ribosomal protein S12 methylthiotransferase RimO [Hydrogenibacillus schlegelii]KWX06096.1 ribosomal protein S12 methylthiotransferase [Hydrogenibacillus schlegelii]OAR03685.1 ribosomal protein S12 methylthiotransferase RimO [Hydrogenibacillus schlegelii]PTQ54145.1 MAG: Ribosomal protein S12p methylthiotransferase [Hydrogenibacillus schlegelii]
MREKVAIVTLGCEKNRIDSEIMADLLERRGYVLVDDVREATVAVVNTCGFIDLAKEESIQTILEAAELKRDRLKSLIVTGCLVQRYQEVLLEEMPEIDGLVGTGDFDRIVEAVEAALAGKRPVLVGHPAISYEALSRRVTPGPSAYVKIAEGCNHRCTFCAIPLMRGRLRSRSIPSIVREVEALVARGVKEVSLIAQDLSSYGLDTERRFMLPALLRALDRIEGLEWVRLHYVYPGALTEALLRTMAESRTVVPYLDMPLQHSVDRLLRAMKRPHGGADVRRLIERVRAVLPDVAIRSSFIVGFPGETEDDFEALLRFLSDVELDRVGVFTYSPEDGTPAAAYPDPVPDAVKEARALRLIEHQRPITQKKNAARIGRVVPVLIERLDAEAGVAYGRTPYDAPEVDGEISVSGYAGPTGVIVPVRVTHAFDYDLAGVYVPEATGDRSPADRAVGG